MQNDQLIVFGQHQILLDIICPHGMSQCFGSQCMLGQITACTAMGNYDFPSVQGQADE